MTGEGWTLPPERPHERALERLRDACRSEPRIARMWLTGTGFDHYDGTDANDATAFVVELDPPSGEGAHDEHVQIVAKLDAAWRPSGRHSFWFPTVRIGANEDSGLPIYAKP